MASFGYEHEQRQYAPAREQAQMDAGALPDAQFQSAKDKLLA